MKINWEPYWYKPIPEESRLFYPFFFWESYRQNLWSALKKSQLFYWVEQLKDNRKEAAFISAYIKMYLHCLPETVYIVWEIQ